MLCITEGPFVYTQDLKSKIFVIIVSLDDLESIHTVCMYLKHAHRYPVSWPTRSTLLACIGLQHAPSVNK